MTMLTAASRQWATRGPDERFTNLLDMRDHFAHRKSNSRAVVCPSNAIEAVAESDNKGLMVASPSGHLFAPSNWAFGQLATLVSAPAPYLRTLPSSLAADNLNYGLKVTRDVSDLGLLLYRNGGEPTIDAATGPKYGRIWNSDITTHLIERFGNGRDGYFRVPGFFGRALDEVTKENTTLYAGDRNMFVFLADEERRIEIPNRRDGKPGSLARGFFVYNSEVGERTFGVETFLFDYVCCNRIVWGATEHKVLKIRHTGGAPDRYLRKIQPALETYARSSATNLTAAIEDARKDRVADNLSDWLAKRQFTKAQAASMVKAHELEEGRPIESRWDVVVAATAIARGYENQDTRIELERKAGELLTA